ncbi:putative BT1 transmembrane domain-containing protein [Neospora caninum Liverpool]|uniref:BT1 transmembrane domain-containing protein,putative n=1 Tax=Neospora caninum (strain Liverpool) TaxID=572307 RepID=F0VKK6_NEOCL|nr:putative BT1 transmembrane domain-containing protein [Neospora caninum Liverpool]CBZ54607.1 putative BT1 transmembrane domain-containing protein [Neospora caninum Liverpool]CEL69321.1 TPA: BT1 transmembrane domain-containing protein,putative [Neospora caninum Liverpool]|eukprot:XP_003884637.1 putative BT1 transmembrane domain-containing protein [Neospora caninum Liverpool]
MGSLSDAVPLGGYRKKYYMILATAAGVLGVCLLAFVSDSFSTEHVWLSSVSVFLICFQLATCELMCAGMYSELMSSNAAVKSDFVIFAFFNYTVGNLFGRGISGFITDATNAQTVYRVALPFAAQVLIPLTLNFIPEKRGSFRVATEKLLENRNMFLMALMVATVSVGLAVVSLTSMEWLAFCYGIFAFVFLSVLLFHTLTPQMARCNLYLFCWAAGNISISGALDYFFTASPVCLPDGPHFDYKYYSTYTALLGTVATLVALWVFHNFLLDWTYVQMAWVTSVVKAVAALFDYIIVRRLNVRAGIPDSAIYFFGDAIVVNLIRTLHNVPGYILTSKLCPRGLEVTAYAILDGISYAGYNIAAQVGAFVISKANVATTEAEGCDFSNLGTLVIATQVAAPILLAPFAFLLLPRVPISAQFPAVVNRAPHDQEHQGALEPGGTVELVEDESHVLHQRVCNRATSDPLVEARGKSRTLPAFRHANSLPTEDTRQPDHSTKDTWDTSATEERNSPTPTTISLHGDG